ncbi:hypothetical protein DERF_008553 [Dermatophagoides farinae]|uniref:Uncharacterized protein n=1 Tax=Dermatophagoides farinae TaxID=6954 RepID=A0A922I3G9_DERFA|nr:hypothetical protein DERF_008553 [Dermatophagoides farinae]
MTNNDIQVHNDDDDDKDDGGDKNFFLAIHFQMTKTMIKIEDIYRALQSSSSSSYSHQVFQ